MEVWKGVLVRLGRLGSQVHPRRRIDSIYLVLVYLLLLLNRYYHCSPGSGCVDSSKREQIYLDLDYEFAC